MVGGDRERSFGALLQGFRRRAGLSQVALATRAGLAVSAISALERGARRRPYPSTLDLLVTVLDLTPAERAVLVAASWSPDAAPAAHPGGAVVAETRASPAPPLVSAQSRPLPDPLTPFVGRLAEAIELARMIRAPATRLVTLTGVGGAGKTRLALAVAHDVRTELADGVWFVDLAPIDNAALVVPMVAGTLGVQGTADTPLLDAIVAALRPRQVLLILDNCEQVIQGCADLASKLLAACPDLRILATSREPLRIAAEARYPVPPLAIPTADATDDPKVLSGVSSAALFVSRAQAIEPEFRLTPANATAIAEICRRLEGIPLAIELAAAWANVLSPAQIAARLARGLALLSSGYRSAPTRQKSLQAALDWSYDLLDGRERELLARLTVFAGGWSLDAAEAVTGSADVLDVLIGLVDKSLVVVVEREPAARYRYLEPVREYTLDRAPSDMLQDARARHARHYAGLAAQAAPLLRGPDQVAWLDRLDREQNNLRAAMRWVAEHETVEAGLQLATTLAPYWTARAHLSEGRGWMGIVLEKSQNGDASPFVRMRALIGAGGLAFWQGDLRAADTLFSEVLATARTLADRRVEAEALAWLTTVHREIHSVERSLVLGQESLRLGQELGDEALIALALLHFGSALRVAGQSARAATILDECRLRFWTLGDLRYTAIASTRLGWALMEIGEHDRATICLREGARDLRMVGDHGYIVVALGGLAHVAHQRGEPRRAVGLLGAAAALRGALGMRPTPRNHANDERLLTALGRQLPAVAFAEAYAAGEAADLDQLLAEIAAVR